MDTVRILMVTGMVVVAAAAIATIVVTVFALKQQHRGTHKHPPHLHLKHVATLVALLGVFTATALNLTEAASRATVIATTTVTFVGAAGMITAAIQESAARSRRPS